jgi:hypothetical protein
MALKAMSINKLHRWSSRLLKFVVFRDCIRLSKPARWFQSCMIDACGVATRFSP